EFLKPLLQMLKEMNTDVDFMIEAKAKDQAMMKLVEDMAAMRGMKRASGGSVILR
ncbi:UV DNA damage repair endonuclease, partial [Cytobacillus horneckiae]